MRIDDLRETLREHALDADDAGTQARVDQRAARVNERVARVNVRVAAARQRRRRAGVAVAGLSLAAVVVGVVGVVGADRGAPPDPSGVATSPPVPEGAPPSAEIGGWTYPGTIVVDRVTYFRGSSYLAAPGSRRLEITTGSSPTPRVLAWSTSSGTQGFTTLTVDGEGRSRSTAGGLESGLVLSPGRAHSVVVVADNLGPRQELALTTYDVPER
jgi:hypothetical protein